MFNWLRRKLGLPGLEAQAWKAQGALLKLQGAVRRLQNKIRLGKRPQRYDQIERDRARRRKAG